MSEYYRQGKGKRDRVRYDNDDSALVVAEQHIDITTPVLIEGSADPLKNPAFKYLMRLGSANSRRVMRTSLNIIARLVGAEEQRGVEPSLAGKAPEEVEITYLQCNWASLRRDHTGLIRQALVERYGTASSIDTRLAALRGTLREAWRDGLMTNDQYQRAIDIDRAAPEERLLSGRMLLEREISDLLRVCATDTRPLGLRDGAMLCVFYSTALRRSELAELRVEHYSPAERKIKVLKAKRRKQREVFLEPGANAILQKWLELRGNKPGPLFCRIDRWSNLYVDKGLTDDGIYWALKARGEQAGLDRFSPHDLRRTTITHLLQKGTDLLTVSKLAGHASANTTRRYDLRPVEAIRDAVDKLGITGLNTDDIVRQRFYAVDDEHADATAIPGNSVVYVDDLKRRMQESQVPAELIDAVMKALGPVEE